MKIQCFILSFLLFACTGSNDSSEEGVDSTSFDRDVSDDDRKERMEAQLQADQELERGVYNAVFNLISAENDIKGALQLFYVMDWRFSFDLMIESPDSCVVQLSDEFEMRSSFQGIYEGSGCNLEFNFKGYNGTYGYVVEIRQLGSCDLLMEGCSWEGSYGSKIIPAKIKD